MAVCKPYRRYCIFDDFTVLLKAILSMAQLVEKTMFFLQAFLFYTVSLDIHQVSDAEKALPHA